MFRVVDQNMKVFKYTGRCKALVVDNVDPLKKGRIRVDHPLTGETSWIPYLQIPGMYFVPEVGDLVYIESDCGFYEYPVAWGNLPKEESETGPLTEVPEGFQRTYPSNRGIYSPDGHLIEVDDGEDLADSKKGIRITTSNESKIHITEEPADKKIIIARNEGATIELDGMMDTITISTDNGDSITLSPSGGIECTNSAGDLVTLTNGTITVENSGGDSVTLSSGNITLTNVAGDTATLNGGDINLTNSSGDSIDLNSNTISIANSGGDSVELSGGNIDIINAAGCTINMSSSGISAKDSTGAGININSGKVALGASAAEVLDVLYNFLNELSTDTFAGFGAPAGKAAIYAQLAIQIQSIKGSL